MNEKRKRPNYTKEFKQDAVRLVIEQGYSGPEAARRLGISSSNVTGVGYGNTVKTSRISAKEVSPTRNWKPSSVD